MQLSDLDTPALVIDLEIMERNLARMADYAAAHALRLRPHTKTHKIPALARRQLDLGAVGLTVAKVGEAEVMQASGSPELLVAYPIIGRTKLDRLCKLNPALELTESLDSEVAAKQLSDAAAAAGRTIQVLAEVDVGLGRVGVTPGESLRTLAEAINRLPGLQFAGIAFYPGHIKRMDEEATGLLRRLGTLLDQAIGDLERAGFPVRIVSGGSTPTLLRSHEVSRLNEIRPGTYIFNDWNTVACGACAIEDCAAAVLTTVVSTSVQDQIIIDGGSKTFSSDRLQGSAEPSFGYLQASPEAVFGKMNEEHGFIDIRETGRTWSVGDKIRLIPNHVCVAVNLHEQVYGLRGDTVEEIWRVEARGKLQ